MLVDPSNPTAGIDGDRRYSPGGASHRDEFPIPVGDGAGRIGPQSAGRRRDVVGARAVPIHRPDLACHHQAIRAGARLWPICRRHHQDRIRPLPGERSRRCAAKFSSCATIRPRTRSWPARSLKPMRRCCRRKLGRSPSEGELYIAHFLGAGGAARLISSAAANPTASAASYFPDCRARQCVDLLRPLDRRAAQPRASAQHSHRALRCGGAVAAQHAGERGRASRYRGKSKLAASPRLAATRPAAASAVAASDSPATHYVRTVPIYPAPSPQPRIPARQQPPLRFRQRRPPFPIPPG